MRPDAASDGLNVEIVAGPNIKTKRQVVAPSACHYNNVPVASPAVVMLHALLCKCETKRKGRPVFIPLSDSDMAGNY